MSGELLEQDEIDALVNGVNSGAVDTTPAPADAPVRDYDFATQTRIVRGRMPTLEMINERMARSLRTSMFGRMLASASWNTPSGSFLARASTDSSAP